MLKYALAGPLGSYRLLLGNLSLLGDCRSAIMLQPATFLDHPVSFFQLRQRGTLAYANVNTKKHLQSAPAYASDTAVIAGIEGRQVVTYAPRTSKTIYSHYKDSNRRKTG